MKSRKLMIVIHGLLMGFIFQYVELWAQSPKAKEEDPEFVKARELFWSGQYRDAELKLKDYLSKHPDHAPSGDFLKMITQSRKYNPAQIAETRKYLETLKVPELQVKEMSWREACLKLELTANSAGGKTPPTHIEFINLLPAKFEKKISLNLKDVSMMEVLERAAQAAELRMVIDTWGVIFDFHESKK